MLRPRKPPWPLGHVRMLMWGFLCGGRQEGQGQAVNIRVSFLLIFPSLFEAQIGSVSEFPYWPGSPR